MVRLPVRLSAGLAAIAWLVGPTPAQPVFVVPEPAHPAPGETVVVRLMAGEPFRGQERAFEPETATLQRLWRSGREYLTGEGKGGPAARLRAGEPGVHLLAYTPRPGGATRSGVLAFGKALVVVGDLSEPDPIWRSELGQRLELVPRTDPAVLCRQGGGFEVQVLFQREPLVGAIVAAVPHAAPESEYRRAKTDLAGRARFELDRSGPWILQVMHKSPRGAVEKAAGWDILSSSLVVLAGSRR